MGLFRKAGIFQDHEKEARAAYDINEKLNLSYYSLWQNVKKLSGGNQQKIVIAKWMLRETEIFLLDEPTRGIDIGAKFEIYNLIHELTEQNKAVILVSPEMEELIGPVSYTHLDVYKRQGLGRQRTEPTGLEFSWRMIRSFSFVEGESRCSSSRFAAVCPSFMAGRAEEPEAMEWV